MPGAVVGEFGAGAEKKVEEWAGEEGHETLGKRGNRVWALAPSAWMEVGG